MRHRSIPHILTAAIAASLLASCDSGDIYPQQDPSEDTRTLHITGTFKGTETVPENDRERKLMLFTYPAGSSTNNRSVRISNIYPEQSETTIEITLVPASAVKFSMAITDAGNSVIYEVCNGTFEQGVTDVEVNKGNINLLKYERLQEQLFDQSCTSCHSSANPSAGLILEKGFSYGNTVNHATTSGNGTRIVPFDTENSVLYNKLTSDDDFHSRFSTLKTNDITLLKSWIIDGATSN